jgi:hypothetical protein
MSTEELLNYAETQNCKVVYSPYLKTKAITLEHGGNFVALSTSPFGKEEKEVAAHELGHCKYGGTYNRYSPYDVKEKAENRAKKWAYNKLVPPGKVREAFKKGVVEPWDLAEQFDVSDEFMCKALEFYKSLSIL